MGGLERFDGDEGWVWSGLRLGDRRGGRWWWSGGEGKGLIGLVGFGGLRGARSRDGTELLLFCLFLYLLFSSSLTCGRIYFLKIYHFHFSRAMKSGD